MRFVSIKHFTNKPEEMLSKINEGDMIITSGGKPVALLFGVTEEALEKTIRTIHHSRALVAIEEMQKGSIERGLNKLTDSEIESEIEAVRRSRRG